MFNLNMKKLENLKSKNTDKIKRKKFEIFRLKH